MPRYSLLSLQPEPGAFIALENTGGYTRHAPEPTLVDLAGPHGHGSLERVYTSDRNRYTLDMNWKDYIVSDPDVLGGKPTIKGTRISVEFVIQRLAQGWTESELLENYPRLTAKHLQAVFTYSQEAY